MFSAVVLLKIPQQLWIKEHHFSKTDKPNFFSIVEFRSCKALYCLPTTAW